MLQRDWRLLNFDTVDAIPAALARGRANAVARALAQADWLLRRKTDGRYLAAVRLGVSARWQLLAPANAWPRDAACGTRGQRAQTGVDALQRRLRELAARPASHATLPLDGVRRHLDALGISADYGRRHALDLVPEPRVLAFAGFDRYRRPLFLQAAAAAAWSRMRAAAAADGVRLEAISGFRSHAYQAGIFARKRARGQGVEEILQVNAAPGYSEHHGGCALDVGTPGEPAAQESFEKTAAFAWLKMRAGDFGFVLSYPRGNPHGIVYEPWHWCWRAC
ncbi:M15 family metallopeptidase [Chiayiivirga flava]|uniref:D-alanyl-D-alanine carboxypeptidase n=1 Tax=Chiayiivirga flava TaxID=659595 RepID=A0A7W8D806_9GAMM|nr:M15 family metallopeptidase [Chiayiivirga flava]MBB5208470.1 D-alanyl-D-alanine carboxypeptidase [Chiayiivirga flava]